MTTSLPGAMSAPTHTDSQPKNESSQVAKIGQKMQAADLLPASTWQYKIKCLAYWVLMAVLGLTIWPTLFYLALRA